MYVYIALQLSVAVAVDDGGIGCFWKASNESNNKINLLQFGLAMCFLLS